MIFINYGQEGLKWKKKIKIKFEVLPLENSTLKPQI